MDRHEENQGNAGSTVSWLANDVKYDFATALGSIERYRSDTLQTVIAPPDPPLEPGEKLKWDHIAFVMRDFVDVSDAPFTFCLSQKGSPYVSYEAQISVTYLAGYDSSGLFADYFTNYNGLYGMGSAYWYRPLDNVVTGYGLLINLPRTHT